jgi:hypothetical protein
MSNCTKQNPMSLFYYLIVFDLPVLLLLLNKEVITLAQILFTSDLPKI